MSKVTLALGSFIVGACSALMMSSGSHISTVVQRSSAFAADPSPPSPPGASAQSTISLPDAIPIVPNLGPTLYGAAVTGGVQQLDGLRCFGCSLNNTQLTYGGGAYDLPGVVINEPVRLELSGAAANTLKLLTFFNVCTSQATPPSPPWLSEPNPKIPINTPASIKGKTIQLISLGGLQ